MYTMNACYLMKKPLKLNVKSVISYGSYFLKIKINYLVEPLIGITYQNHRTIRRYRDVGRYRVIPTPFTATYVRRWYNSIPTYG
jgi:hypothetical protein